MYKINAKYECKKCGNKFLVNLERLAFVECPNCGAKGYHISPLKHMTNQDTKI